MLVKPLTFNIMKNKIQFKERPMGMGLQAKLQFDNGFGVSIIQSDFSYGGKDGLYEMALTNEYGHVMYDDDLFTDVIGHLPEDEIDSLIEYVKAK